MTFKQKIYAYCIQSVDDRIHLLQTHLSELGESAQHETKSTAGDKHETALAMLQIEQANIRKQWKEALELKAILDRTDISILSAVAIRGSMVKTNRGYFFISIAMGKIIIDEIPVIALSPQSPLGALFIGLPNGASTEWNGIKYTIEAIL